MIFKADEARISGIKPGEDWRKRIVLELKGARVLVGLATAHSILSKWLWIEASVVWPRENTKIVFLATPDLRPEQLSPFDHLQFQFLSAKNGHRVRDAVIQVVEQAGGSPRWTRKAATSLDRIIAVAARIPTEKSTATDAEAEVRRSRDRKVLLRLLKVRTPDLVQ